MSSKILRIGGIVAVIALLILVIASSFAKPSASSAIWDERTTLGDVNNTNHYIMYTDIMCPYCDVFSRAIMNHEDEFKKDYIEEKKIVFEVRVTDMLYESNGSSAESSVNGAEAIYCATDQNKFWDYYHASIQALWDDYHSKGIGSSKTAPAITGMGRSYWEKIAQKIEGLDQDQWQSCYNDHQMLDKIRANTAKAAKQTDGGLPYFKFNKFTTGGFDNNWGWDYVKKYLDAGLSS